MDWPNIAAPAYPLAETWEDPAIRSDFEAGYEQTRARYTRSRATFGLHWGLMSTDDKADLKLFWDSTMGGSASFYWRHPVTGKVHEVRFVAAPTIRAVTHNGWEVDLALREV